MRAFSSTVRNPNISLGAASCRQRTTPKTPTTKFLTQHSCPSASFSSFGQEDTKRYYPQYTVFKRDCCFILKFQGPLFKTLSDNNKNVSRKGKLRFEIAPRGTGSNLTDWDSAVSMNLSTESVGQILVDFSKRKESKLTYDETTFSTTPMSKGSYKFEIVYGQRIAAIVLSAGEIEVIKSLARHSIPQLVAWDSLIQKSVDSLLTSDEFDYV